MKGDIGGAMGQGLKSLFGAQGQGNPNNGNVQRNMFGMPNQFQNMGLMGQGQYGSPKPGMDTSGGPNLGFGRQLMRFNNSGQGNGNFIS